MTRFIRSIEFTILALITTYLGWFIATETARVFAERAPV